MSTSARFRVAGVRIDAVDLDDAIDTILGFVADGRREYVVLTGAHGVVEMQTDPELRDINEGAGLVTPDGMSVVWLGRLLGHPRTSKVYAPNLMEGLFDRGRAQGLVHFFYGGGPGVAERLAASARARFPGLLVAGAHCPPFRALTDAEAQSEAALIDAAEPTVVWVGLGCPKQERWMARMRPLLRAPVLVGVGAGFDFLSGKKPLAPPWIRTSGFEWLFRTATEPRRLAPRYARVVPRFVFHAGVDLATRLARRAGRSTRGGSRA